MSCDDAVHIVSNAKIDGQNVSVPALIIFVSRLMTWLSAAAPWQLRFSPIAQLSRRSQCLMPDESTP